MSLPVLLKNPKIFLIGAGNVALQKNLLENSPNYIIIGGLSTSHK